MSARGTTFGVKDTLVVEECCNCHMLFAMTEEFWDDRHKDKQSFCCPAGHRQSYKGKSDAEKIRELESAVAKEKDNAKFWMEQERRAIINAKTQRTKLNNRIAKGICPCCKRSFVALERHMTNQHPDFAVEKDGVVR